MKYVVLALASLLTFSACQKEEDNSVEEPLPNPYLTLKVGNAWVYRVESMDPRGENVRFMRNDTDAVVKDTTIRGLVFAKFRTRSAVGGKYFTFLRDSAGFIVDDAGRVFLSPYPNNAVVHRGLKQEYRSATMVVQSTPRTTSAGTFTDCLSRRSYLWPDESLTGGEFRELRSDHVFARGVGPVFQSSPYVSGARIERKLVLYRLL